MEVDPAVALKRKSTSLDTSFELCIICQDSSRELLRTATKDGNMKVKECAQKRRKLQNTSNVGFLDRIETLSERAWNSEDIKWHKPCYSSVTSANHLQRLHKKYNESSEVQCSEESATQTTSRRRKSDPVDWEKVHVLPKG